MVVVVEVVKMVLGVELGVVVVVVMLEVADVAVEVLSLTSGRGGNSDCC